MEKVINLGLEGGINLKRYLQQKGYNKLSPLVAELGKNKTDLMKRSILRRIYRWLNERKELKITESYFRELLAAVGESIVTYPYLPPEEKQKFGDLTNVIPNDITGRWYFYSYAIYEKALFLRTVMNVYKEEGKYKCFQVDKVSQSTGLEDMCYQGDVVQFLDHLSFQMHDVKGPLEFLYYISYDPVFFKNTTELAGLEISINLIKFLRCRVWFGTRIEIIDEKIIAEKIKSIAKLFDIRTYPWEEYGTVQADIYRAFRQTFYMANGKLGQVDKV